MTGQSDGWRNYAGERGELPEHPFLIVVLPTLVEQVAQECQRFLEPGSFDIIKITGAMDQHCELWEVAESRSAAAAHMRIYIATTTVSMN